MKTLKSIILGLVAVLTVSAVSAKTKTPANEKNSVNYAVTAYVDAVTHGKNSELRDVLDSELKFTMLRGKSTVSFNKSELLDFMKSTDNVEQNCKTVVTPSNDNPNPDVSVVKVEMQYKDFTRVNYVTLSNTHDGWKITNIYSVFK